MPYADVRDIRLYYEEQGQGAPIILLHGATGAIGFHAAGWDDHVPALAARYRVIQIEHRGHGRTINPLGRLSYAQIADDLATFIDALDLAPAHLAGLSDGGIVALSLAMTRPELVETIVCVGANYRNDEQVTAALQIFDPEMIEREEPDWVAALVAFHDSYQYPGYWRELVRQLKAMFDVEPAYTQDDLRRVAAPTLLIAGEHDPIGNLDQTLTLRQCIPQSEMLILNHAAMSPINNHIVQHTRAGIVGPVMLQFLDRHAERSTPASDAP